MNDQDFKLFEQTLSDQEIDRRVKILNRHCKPLKEIPFVDAYLKLMVLRIKAKFRDKTYSFP